MLCYGRILFSQKEPLMLSNLTIIFPLVVALGILLWFCRWISIHKNLTLEAQAAPLPEKTPFFSRNDWIILSVLTVVYGIVAFWGLGQNIAPQSFLHYEAGNYYAQIELHEEQEITAVRYYSGLCTADYKLQFSTDGENWTEQLKDDGTSGMTQRYTQLFRWNDATLNDDNGPVKYIRIVSGAEQFLGEVALYGADGDLLSTEEFTVASGCEALFDEQDVIPESYNFRNGTYFDEIYHPRTALEMIEGIWPYEITHPPLGKAIISLGIRIFGMTPFGWRFMGVLFGILMLPMLYVFLKKMFRYTAVAFCGTAIFAFDFMHYTQTRLATIDTYAVFFTLMMYMFMYFWLTEDDDHPRRRLLWLGLAGLGFGLGAASKWTCIYAGAGLGVLWLIHWVVRFAKEKKAVLSEFILNAAWCVLFFVGLPFLIYYVSYYSYGISQGLSGIGMFFRKDYAQIVFDNQVYMWNYHSGLESTHPYSSRWYQWLVDARPILYYLEYFEGDMKSTFGAFSNPLVAWGGLCAMGGMVWLSIREKDNKALFILIGYLTNLLPWVAVNRLTFAYHYFPCTVFLVLAISYLLADLRRKDWKWPLSVGGFTAVGIGLFVMFYPVLSGIPVSGEYTSTFLKWFTDSWPF